MRRPAELARRRAPRLPGPGLQCRAGGQAKRTNIGVALISSPRILFLDEPTSGLDSYTSLEVRRTRSAARGLLRPARSARESWGAVVR